MRTGKNRKATGLAIFACLLLFLIVFSKIRSATRKDPDVSSIKAEFTGEIGPGQNLRASMFRVTGETANGKSVQIHSFQAEPVAAPGNGSDFGVTVTAQGQTASVTVPVTREVQSSANIGLQREDSATVTLYTNGDLVFSGSGPIKNFGTNLPWKKMTNSRLQYTHVYFSKELEIPNIDGWFSDNDSLIYCSELPKSLKSMKSAFSGCTALEKAPDYFGCEELKIADNAFSGCTSLTEADTLPVNLRSAAGMFSDCPALRQAVDMSKTSSLTNISGIYQNDTGLVDLSPVPESVSDMSQAFSGCINIQNAVPFPESVLNISGTYQDCTSLTTGAAIPESADNISNCYSGCSSLCGTLEINTDTNNYSGVLSGAAAMGDALVISGNSGNLLAIQQDSGMQSISLADPQEAAKQNQRMIAENGGEEN